MRTHNAVEVRVYLTPDEPAAVLYWFHVPREGDRLHLPAIDPDRPDLIGEVVQVTWFDGYVALELDVD